MDFLFQMLGSIRLIECPKVIEGNCLIILTQSFFSKSKYLGSRLIFCNFTKEHTIFSPLQKIISCVPVALTYTRLGKDESICVICCSQNWVQFSNSNFCKLEQARIECMNRFGSISQQLEIVRFIRFEHSTKCRS